MGPPESPDIEFDVTVLEECRHTTFIALKDTQKLRFFEYVDIGIDLESDIL